MDGTVAGALFGIALTFLVAVLYSCVGHGGASGYLAIMTFLSVSHEAAASSALALNVLVAGTALFFFCGGSYLRGALTWPFLVLSVPAAFLGGLLDIPRSVYGALLAFALLCASLRLAMSFEVGHDHGKLRAPTLWISMPLGAGIGFLSGIVGVGGGIFLSPLILLARWAGAKETAATSACFILINSAAALLARLLSGRVEIFSRYSVSLLLLAAFLGALLGSHLGAKRFAPIALRRILALVLAFASLKLL